MSEDWSPRTKLVHEGIRRSQYGEVAEAIFLTQGFVYETAEAAEARFIKAGRTSSSMRATATRPCACSRNASPRSKAPRTVSRRHREWPR